MQINEISIGSESATEYLLRAPSPASMPAKESAVQKPAVRQKSLKLEDFATLYSHEECIEVEGIKYPFVLINQFDELRTQSLHLSPKPYSVPARFKRFAEGFLKAKLSLSTFNGGCVGIAEIQVEGVTTKINGRRVGYFDFMATNLAQDAYLAQFDNSFGAEETLRGYEIREGRQIDLKESNLTNMVGVGFMILNKSSNRLIFAQRRKDLVVEGGTISIPGGTPVWNNNWKPPREIYFPGYLQAHFAEELEEELCLAPEEFKFRRGLWLKDFTRAPDLIVYLETNVPLNEIANRCAQSETALKEHETLYGVPFNERTLQGFVSVDSKYVLNALSVVAFKLALQAF
ncbi:MAG: hypothetical protein AABX07_04680 [Nanoarchaeota archaeon]